MRILIIGGTRNIGFKLLQTLLEAGHQVTLLNRGVSGEGLPEGVAWLTADRTNTQQMRRALGGREFDVVIDMVLFKPGEAEDVVDIFNGVVGRYVFISTGQVYLVQEGITEPTPEEQFQGPLRESPPPNTYDYEEWLYGMEKYQAEEVLFRAYADKGFPYTSLRLPMVNSERDTFRRLYNYVLRVKDGGPILTPDEPEPHLRHVYSGDVVRAIHRLIDFDGGRGRAYNIAQDEILTLSDFVALLGKIIGQQVELIKVARETLHIRGFLPDCSPFSDRWMSHLDNSRSKAELGLAYTPPHDYLEKIIAYYEADPPPIPHSYNTLRHAEKQFRQG